MDDLHIACPKCRAAVGERCHNYKGKNKAICPVRARLLAGIAEPERGPKRPRGRPKKVKVDPTPLLPWAEQQAEEDGDERTDLDDVTPLGTTPPN